MEDPCVMPAEGMVEHEVILSLDGPSTKVFYDYVEGTGLQLSWSHHAALGVYIQDAGGNIRRAGTLYGHNDVEGTRGPVLFNGVVSELHPGESYIYMHPDIADEDGIDYEHQLIRFGDTNHIRAKVPLIWRDNGDGSDLHPEIQAYVIRLHMQFRERPGIVTKVRVHTMDRFDETQESVVHVKDRIFPKRFDVARLAQSVNHILPALAEGDKISESLFSDKLEVDIEDGYVHFNSESGLYEEELFVVCPAVKNLDITQTKFHVDVECGLGNCKSTFNSFSQQSISDGRLYNLESKHTVEICATEIDRERGVFSLLGTWNHNGLPIDSEGYIWDGSNYKLPTQLDSIISKPVASFAPVPDAIVQDVPKEIRITEPTELFVTFLSENTTRHHAVAYYFYDTEDSDGITPSSCPKVIILPELNSPYVSLDRTARLLYRDSEGFVSTTFPAGTTVGFAAFLDAKATSAHDGMMDWDGMKMVFTRPEWNPGSETYFFSANVAHSIVDEFGDEKDEYFDGVAFYEFKENPGAGPYDAARFFVSSKNPYAIEIDNTAIYNIDKEQ